MQSLVANLIAAYRESITGLAWMGEETNSWRAGSSTLRAKIGYPDRWRDWSALQIDPPDLLGNWLMPPAPTSTAGSTRWASPWTARSGC